MATRIGRGRLVNAAAWLTLLGSVAIPAWGAEEKAIRPSKEAPAAPQPSKAGLPTSVVVRLNLEIVIRKGTIDAGVAVNSKPAAPELSRLGIEVVTPAPRPSGRPGVTVTAVQPGSPAARAGLEPGMVIAAVDRKPVRSVDDFRRRLEQGSVHDGLRLRAHSPSGWQTLVLREQSPR